MSGNVNKKELFTVKPVLKQNQAIMEMYLQQKTFTVQRTGSTEHPNFNYL